MYDRAMRREMRGQEFREGFINPLLDMFGDYNEVAGTVSREVQRRADKVRRWIQMYNDVPDSYDDEPLEKTKRIPKRDQTVRLSDDGELVFEDEPQHKTAGRDQ
jgi:hypothetical protein